MSRLSPALLPCAACCTAVAPHIPIPTSIDCDVCAMCATCVLCARATPFAPQTYEPSLVGHMLLMVQRLVRSHPGVAPALVPHLK